MGLLDKATGGLTNRFQRGSEETVRMVDYDAVPVDEPVAKEPKAPKVAREKTPRPKLGDLLPARGAKDKKTLVPDELEIDEEPEPYETPVFTPPVDTAFDLDDEEPNFYQKQQERYDENKPSGGNVFDELPEKSNGSKGKKEEVVYDEAKIRDVLEVLKIPTTFVIPPDVLMPDDFPTIDFDLQVPQGYDIGQVEFFVERADSTVQEYLRLLEQRNEHVAKLATTVDRLQVDLQNLKYDSQIAAGIGIMPTSDNDELERENMELKLQVKRLEDQIKAKTRTPDLSSKERELYENLRNQYSIIQRERDELEQQVVDLRTQIAALEEDADDPSWMAGSQVEGLPGFDLDAPMPDLGMPSGIEIMDGGSLPEPVLPDLALPSALPDFSDNDDEDEELALPDFSGNSSFDVSEEKFSESSFEGNDNEDDDELDKLMKGWG